MTVFLTVTLSHIMVGKLHLYPYPPKEVFIDQEKLEKRKKKWLQRKKKKKEKKKKKKMRDREKMRDQEKSKSIT